MWSFLVKHRHYFKNVSRLTEIDVYKVCSLFEVVDSTGALHHAIKKLLCSGQRGAGKGKLKDIREAKETLERYLEIIKEECCADEISELDRNLGEHF